MRILAVVVSHREFNCCHTLKVSPMKLTIKSSLTKRFPLQDHRQTGQQRPHQIDGSHTLCSSEIDQRMTQAGIHQSVSYRAT